MSTRAAHEIFSQSTSLSVDGLLMANLAHDEREAQMLARIEALEAGLAALSLPSLLARIEALEADNAALRKELGKEKPST